MEGTAQDQFIQKKLLYIFDKKLDVIYHEYFTMLYDENYQNANLDGLI
jgi:hypothetical protein